MLHVWVFVHVLVVIEIDEAVIDDLSVDGECDELR